MACIGDLADLLIGPPFKSKIFRSTAAGTRLLRGINLGPGTTRWEETFFWPDAELEPFVKYLLADGDLCIAMDATFAKSGSIRGASLRPDDLPSLLVQRVARLRVDDPLLRRFLWLILTCQPFADHLTGRQTGAFAPHISGKDIASFEFQLPPRHEQRRIVDLVDALDGQIEALDLELDCLGRLVRSLRETLVANVPWKPVATMVELNGVQIGPFGSQLHAHEYASNGIPVVMPQDLIDGEIVTAKIKYVPEATAIGLARHRLLPGDLILPRRGDLTKRALVKPEQAGWLCGTGCIRIRLADPVAAPALLEGLSNARTDEWLTTNAVGTTMLNLNTEIVKKLPAPWFSEERGLADACVAAHRLLRVTKIERASLSSLRRQALTALTTGDLAIPDSYDDVMAGSV